MEFKGRGLISMSLAGSRVRSSAALAQIREKGYAAPYLADGRPVYLIGLAFDSKTRQLVDAAWEPSTSL